MEPSANHQRTATEIERAAELQLSNERQVLEDQLRQAQKMECIGQLAGGIAHDFSNLLTAIIGYTDLTILDLDDRESALDNLRQIRLAGERAAQLTGQLLAFARKQVLSQKVISLNELILNLERMLRRLIREDIELVILPGDELGLVKADAGLLEQVIVNMVVNARQAMPAGGKLTVETANLRLAEGVVPPRLEMAPGDYVELSIRDTGIGMSEEVQAHIFEPFFTTKERGQGTGLGLATCYGIVKQNEGHITFTSAPGAGTTFRVFLPRTREVAEMKSLGTYSETPGGQETILLVEDEVAARGFATKVLRKLGYTVLETSNGPEALRVAENYPGTIHLLLTDMVMPHMSGKEVAEEVLLRRMGIKVLYTSGYMADAMGKAGMIDAEVHFLQKPYTTAILGRKIREVLDGQG